MHTQWPVYPLVQHHSFTTIQNHEPEKIKKNNTNPIIVEDNLNQKFLFLHCFTQILTNNNGTIAKFNVSDSLDSIERKNRELFVCVCSTTRIFFLGVKNITILCRSVFCVCVVYKNATFETILNQLICCYRLVWFLWIFFSIFFMF